MQNKLTPWHVLAKFGNPTHLIVVNLLVKQVRKQEYCKQGKASQVCHDIAPAEYEQVIEIMEVDVMQLNWYLYLASFHFQVHLIARVDDVSKVYIADIWLHPQLNFVLVTKLCSSKNVMDERDCLDQIIVGLKISDTVCLLAWQSTTKHGLLWVAACNVHLCLVSMVLKTPMQPKRMWPPTWQIMFLAINNL